MQVQAAESTRETLSSDPRTHSVHDQNRYVSDVVASEITGIPFPTLRRWRHERRGPRYVKVGGSVRYKVAWLNEYMAQRVVETRDSARPQEAA